jgi:hypothetical protein
MRTPEIQKQGTTPSPRAPGCESLKSGALIDLLRNHHDSVDLARTRVARIEAADVPELDVWTERVVTASRLEDVLGPTRA